ncbi:MAG: hypothetical protein NVS3B12_13370 [Acidimicrobiales bacterium]
MQSTRRTAGLILAMLVIAVAGGFAATTGPSFAQVTIPKLGSTTTSTTKAPPTTSAPPPTAAPGPSQTTPETTPPAPAPTEAPTVPPPAAATPPQAPVTFPAPAIAPQLPVPLPVPRPPVTLRPERKVPLTSGQRSFRRARFARGLPSATVVAGSYGIGVTGVLIIAFLLITLSALAKSQRSAVIVSTGGTTMDRIRTNNRLPIGFACLGLAVVVAILGYLGLSRNADVNRQIPYLASAGMAVVILATIGGAFIVAEQLRNDDKRIAELEDAVRLLAGAVAPALEAPARVASRSAAADRSAAAVYEPEPSADDLEIAETVPAAAGTGRTQRVAKRISRDRA